MVVCRACLSVLVMCACSSGGKTDAGGSVPRADTSASVPNSADAANDNTGTDPDDGSRPNLDETPAPESSTAVGAQPSQPMPMAAAEAPSATTMPDASGEQGAPSPDPTDDTPTELSDAELPQQTSANDDAAPDSDVVDDESTPPLSMGEPVESERADVPTPRGEHGVGALRDEVYVLGGFTPSVTSSVQVYTPETDSWRDVADFPVVFHHPNVASVGDRLYVLGFHSGMGQRMGDGSSYVYDPDADDWTEVAPQPLGTERGASCVTTYQDKIYVFGGTNDVALPEASVYDPANDSWEVLPPMPALRHHCIAGVVNDKIYIVSGRDVVIEEVQTESYVFDPETRSYDEVAPIPTPRGGAAGGELGGRIYVFGGEGNKNDPDGIFHEAEVYDPTTDTWAALPDMTVPRHGFGAAVIDDRMYLPGGSIRQGIASQATHTVFYLEDR